MNAIDFISTVPSYLKVFLHPTFEDGQANIEHQANGQHGTRVTHITDRRHRAACRFGKSAFSKPRVKQKNEPPCPPLNSSASILIVAPANSAGSGTGNKASADSAGSGTSNSKRPKRPLPGAHIGYLVDGSLRIPSTLEKECIGAVDFVAPANSAGSGTGNKASADSAGSGAGNSKRPLPWAHIDYLVDGSLRIPSTLEKECIGAVDFVAPANNAGRGTGNVASADSAGSGAGNSKRPKRPLPWAHIDYLVDGSLRIPSTLEKECIGAVDFVAPANSAGSGTGNVASADSAGSGAGNSKRPLPEAHVEYLVDGSLSVPSTLEKECIAAVDFMQSAIASLESFHAKHAQSGRHDQPSELPRLRQRVCDQEPTLFINNLLNKKLEFRINCQQFPEEGSSKQQIETSDTSALRECWKVERQATTYLKAHLPPTQEPNPVSCQVKIEPSQIDNMEHRTIMEQLGM